MKSLQQFINEWKEDLNRQVVIIMGTPGCGKTYWMQHHGINFFKTQGIKLNPKELDVDHTLKFFQLIDFPKFCQRVINYKGIVINDKQIHNNKPSWEAFIQNEKNRYTELNKANGGLDTNIPELEKIEYNFVAPWLTRYENATDDNKEQVLKEFTKAMYDKYFNSVFASDFSVRDEAKVQYKKDLTEKLSNNQDVFVAISGAKVKHIKEISDICKDSNATCRIVYLNGSLEKAIGQDAKRERSGGKDFVIDYAKKINEVWNQLIDPSSEVYFKSLNIYNIYEMKDVNEDDIDSYPKWKLEKIYK